MVGILKLLFMSLPYFRLSAQVHPLPSFDNLTALNYMVGKMEELGFWLMYGMSG